MISFPTDLGVLRNILYLLKLYALNRFCHMIKIIKYNNKMYTYEIFKKWVSLVFEFGINFALYLEDQGAIHAGNTGCKNTTLLQTESQVF
jgi:hypothetical protein